MADWQTLYYRMKNCAAGYSNYCDESGSTRKLEREFEQIDSDARALKSSPPVAVQEERDANEKLLKDLRWRLDDIRDMLMKEGHNGDRIYGCDEWSTPTVNLATAISVIDKALAAMKGDQP